jgi:SAM-dependent methyltransferase
MDQLTRALVEGMVSVFRPEGPVVEIGSRRVQDVAYWDLRPLFPGRQYVGCDAEAGPGVDCVQRIESLSLADGWAGTVLCLNVLEHVWPFREGVAEMHRVTAPGGFVLVTTAFGFDIHGFPDDYWRFTPQALARLFEPFEGVIYGWQGHGKAPRAVFVLGRKGPLEDAEGQAAAWRRETLARWSEHPSAWKRIGAGVGAALFGKRYFRNIRHWWNLELVAARGGTDGR